MRRFLELLQRFDWILLTAVLTLTAMGLVAIYGISISQGGGDLFSFYKQFAGALLGLAAIVGLVLLDYRHIRSFSMIFYLAGALLLLTVLFFGHTVNGHQGWLRLGTISFQPVEAAKLTLVVYLSAFFVRREHGRLSWHTFGLGAAATAAYVFLIMLQPDFGSAAVLVALWGAMSLFAGLPRRAWLFLPLGMVLIAIVLWTVGLRPYQRDRIVTFLHPTADVRGAGYNAAQARIAIGSGGWLGKGIGEGSQARLRFLPEASTDFMFAVFGEELGFVGVAVVLSLYGLLIFRFIRLAQESEDDFAALLLVGLGSVFLIHVVVNAGMNLGIMPVTGVPIPFISYAASSLVVAYLAIGLAESVAVRRRGHQAG